MKFTEDRLRAALAETAREIPAGSVPPLDLAAAGRSAGRATRMRRRAPGSRGIKIMAAPIAAATAVVAVIAASSALSGGSHDPRPGTAPRSVNLDSVPPYYMARVGKVAKDAPGLALRGVIRHTLSGKPVATMLLPKPYRYVRAVAGSANDRTFLVAARNTTKLRGDTGFYLAQFSPATRKVTVRRLDIPPVPSPPSMVQGLAVSPNGTQVAIAVSTKEADGSTLTEVSVYWLTTGQVKVWESRTASIGLSFYDPTALSWSSNGELAFNATTDSRPYSVWLLNTATAAGNLITDSRFIDGDHKWSDGDGLVTPSGTRVVTPMARLLLPGNKVEQEFAEYSTVTRKQVAVLYKTEDAQESLDWTNSSGSVLVVGVQLQDHASGQLGVVIGKRFTPLRGAPSVLGITATISF